MSSEALKGARVAKAPPASEASGEPEGVIALRRRAYRELPLAGPGVREAVFSATASYSEIAAAFAPADVGADAGQMATALASLYREAGYEAWVLHFGRPPTFVHAVTLVRVDGTVWVQDAYFNRGFDLDIERLLDAVAAGEAPRASSPAQDRKICIVEARAAPEALRWITAHADQELAAVGALRRFVCRWSVAAATSTDAEAAAVLGGDPERGLDALMLHPLGLQDGATLHPPWERMPVVGDWFRRREGGEGHPTPVAQQDRRSEYLFALSHRLSRAGEAMLDPDLAKVTGAFAELSETVRATSAQIVAAKDREEALREEREDIIQRLAEAVAARHDLEARAAADAAAAEAAREGLESRLAETGAALASAQIGLDDARARQEELSIATAVEAAERRGVEARLAEEAARLAAAQQANEGLARQVAKAQAETAAARVGLAAAAAERDAAVQARRAEQDRLRSELEALRAAVASRDGVLERAQGELEVLRAAIEESEARTAAERSRAETAEAAALATETALAEDQVAAQLRLADLERLASERVQQVDALRQELSAIAAAGARAERQQAERLQGLEAQHTAAKAALAVLKVERDAATARLEGERITFEAERDLVVDTLSAERVAAAAALAAEQDATAERLAELEARQERRLARLAEFASVIDGAANPGAATDPFGALENLERSHGALRSEREALQAERELLRARDRRRLGARLKRLFTLRRA